MQNVENLAVGLDDGLALKTNISMKTGEAKMIPWGSIWQYLDNETRTTLALIGYRIYTSYLEEQQELKEKKDDSVNEQID